MPDEDEELEFREIDISLTAAEALRRVQQFRAVRDSQTMRSATSSQQDRDENTVKSLKGDMKHRHLSKNERDYLHQPKTDWCQTTRGEECRSACTLVVDDIVSKHLR